MFTVLLSIVMIIVASFTPQTSSYSYVFGVLDCNNTMPLRGCRHEIGHKMDHDLGVPSESPEFGRALQQYMLDEFKKDNPDQMATFLMTYPGIFSYNPTQISSPQKELYAAIYSWVEGDIYRIPVSLRRFYSTDPRYLDLYTCLAHKGKFNVCPDNSFSYIERSQ